jgi:hypothetical protein
VRTIQGNLILALRELLTWNSIQAWLFTGMGIRQAQALRLGIEYNNKLSNRQKEIHRRTFWACFTMDRLITVCCARPQMIDLDSIRLNLPCPENTFAFDQTCSVPPLEALTLPTNEVHRLGLAPYFLAILNLWGQAIYFQGLRGRRYSKNAPTDPDGRFKQLETKIFQYYNALPQCLIWNQQNRKLHHSTGQADLFINFHFMLNHARFVMHVDYLPQHDAPNLAPDQIPIEAEYDSAGISFSHRDEQIVSICISGADAIVDMISTLRASHVTGSGSTQWVFAANALLSAACVQLWIQHVELHNQVAVDAAKQKLDLMENAIKSWQPQWLVAFAWLDTFQNLCRLYEASYPKEVPMLLEESDEGQNEAITMPATEENHETFNSLRQGPFEGNGVPDPDKDYQRLCDRIRFTILASLEFADVKKRVLNSSLKRVRQQMRSQDPSPSETRIFDPGDLFLGDDISVLIGSDSMLDNTVNGVDGGYLSGWPTY